MITKQSKDKKHFINIIIGDESGDGHDKTHISMISSNLSKEELASALKKGEKLSKVSLDTICHDYEDNKISKKDWIKLVKSGAAKIMCPDETEEDMLKWICDDSSNFPNYVWVDDFLALYLALVKLGNPEFEGEEAEGTSIYIGGYGIFA